jgi:hypothetical protein
MFGLSMAWVREMLWGKKKSRYLLACGLNLLVVPSTFLLPAIDSDPLPGGQRDCCGAATPPLLWQCGR